MLFADREYSIFGYWISAKLSLSATLALFSVVSPAFADRHCYPVLDSYFVIRGYVSGAGQSCPGLSKEVEEELESALDSARICSCTELIDLVDGLLSEVQEATTCTALTGLINERTADIEETVASCHLY